MKGKFLIACGISALMSITGCSNASSGPKEEKSEEITKQKDVEKTPYDVLEEAAKKSESWKSWGIHRVESIHQADIYGMSGKVFDLDLDEYTNVQIADNVCYQVSEWDEGDWQRFRIVYATNSEIIQASGYGTNAPSPLAGHISFTKYDSDKEIFKSSQKAISLNEAFNDPEIFESSLITEEEKTIVTFKLKDPQKYQDYLLKKNEDAESKITLENGLEINDNYYTQYDWTYEINQEGIIESYQYDITENFTEDMDSINTATITFYDMNTIEMDTVTIDSLIEQIPKDQEEGELTGDITYSVTRP